MSEVQGCQASSCNAASRRLLQKFEFAYRTRLIYRSIAPLPPHVLPQRRALGAVRKLFAKCAWRASGVIKRGPCGINLLRA